MNEAKRRAGVGKTSGARSREARTERQAEITGSECQTPLHGHRLRICCTRPPTDKLTTILQLVIQKNFATSQCQSPTSRHVQMLGCGKFLSVGGEFVVRVVEFGSNAKRQIQPAPPRSLTLLRHSERCELPHQRPSRIRRWSTRACLCEHFCCDIFHNILHKTPICTIWRNSLLECGGERCSISFILSTSPGDITRNRASSRCLSRRRTIIADLHQSSSIILTMLASQAAGAQYTRTAIFAGRSVAVSRG